MASIAMGVMGALSAAGAIGGGILQSNAASSAAQTEQNAATQASTLEGNAATAAEGAVNTATGTANTDLATGLATGNQTLADALAAQKTALAPYLAAGTTSLSSLQNALTGLTSPTSQFSFNPATSPQLQFEQQQAQQALQRQAAAQGTVLGGGTVRASDIMNTGLASTYLNQAFNQALAQYNTNRQNTLTQIQGLTNLTGLGYNATGALNQDLGVTGQATNSNIQNVSGRQAANTINAGMFTGNTGLTTAQLQAGNTIGAANAVAGNQLAQGKIWGNALNSLTGTAGNLYGLSQAPGPIASSQPGWSGAAAPPPGGYDLGADSSFV